MYQNKKKWRPEAEFLVWREDLALTLNNRPSLVDMADCEVLERFRLSRERIQWLVDELQEEMERNTLRSCPLSPETQVNIVLLLLLLSFTF